MNELIKKVLEDNGLTERDVVVSAIGENGYIEYEVIKNTPYEKIS